MIYLAYLILAVVVISMIFYMHELVIFIVITFLLSVPIVWALHEVAK